MLAIVQPGSPNIWSRNDVLYAFEDFVFFRYYFGPHFQLFYPEKLAVHLLRSLACSRRLDNLLNHVLHSVPV